MSRPEARAGAFAAELLLPQEEAGSQMASAAADPRAAAYSLSRRHGVSLELVAGQARNSSQGQSLPAAVHEWLRARVSQPENY